MGLDVMLVSKDRGENRVIYGDLSRSFCNFLCGPDAYETSEFEQVQKLTGLDLSIFRSYPLNFEPNTDDLEYKLSLAEEENDSLAIERIKSEIERGQKEWEKNYDLINEGWIMVEDLSAITNELIVKLQEKSNLDKQIDYNFNWGQYFENKKRAADQSHLDNHLIEDLLSLRNGLEQMSQQGVTYVSFIYG